MFNYCFLGGEVSEGPEITLTKDGRVLALFKLAIWENATHSAGFVWVLCLHQLATVADTYLTPGECVVVMGYLYRTWVTAFYLRLVCTNGLIARAQITTAYRHISGSCWKISPACLSAFQSSCCCSATSSGFPWRTK